MARLVASANYELQSNSMGHCLYTAFNVIHFVATDGVHCEDVEGNGVKCMWPVTVHNEMDDSPILKIGNTNA